MQRQYKKKDILILSSLVLILLAVPLINSILQPLISTKQVDDRFIASIQSLETSSKKSQKNDYMLLKRLASNERLSQIGRKPSQIEQFQFGVLNGQYKIIHNKDGIYQLKVQSGDDPTQFKKVKNKVEFLQEHRSLWSIPFQHAEKSVEVKIGDRNSEIFVLKNAQKQSVGKAIMLLSEDDGMVSLDFKGFSYN